jgi:phosphate uptake regulator
MDIAEKDETINVGERMVRRMVAQHLTINPEQDLPSSLVLISIVHDVERIGDYTKGLIELSRFRPPI